MGKVSARTRHKPFRNKNLTQFRSLTVRRKYANVRINSFVEEVHSIGPRLVVRSTATCSMDRGRRSSERRPVKTSTRLSAKRDVDSRGRQYYFDRCYERTPHSYIPHGEPYPESILGRLQI